MSKVKIYINTHIYIYIFVYNAFEADICFIRLMYIVYLSILRHCCLSGFGHTTRTLICYPKFLNLTSLSFSLYMP